MQVSRAAATYLLINNAYAGAKTIKQIMSMMDPIDETDSNTKDQALSNTLKKAPRQEERLLDEIAIEDKDDKKNQKADAGVLILQGQDDGTRCTYLDGTIGVKCVGEYACTNVVTADIACGSCWGYRSCYGLTGTTTVGEDSCRGNYACYEAVDTTIGMKSCIGNRVCYLAENTTIACRGTSACYGAVDMTIGNQSCIGFDSCEEAERSTIGIKSCVDKESCDSIEDMTIGNESCNGEDSCEDAVHSTIGIKSCIDNDSCNGIKDMTIADRSCHGYEACFEAESTTILAGSCIGYCVCEYIYDSAVGTLSCIGDFACDVTGYNEHTIIVGDDSCSGTQSCYNVDPAGKEFANRF